MKTNNELCVDLKTTLVNEVLMKPGKNYPGIMKCEFVNEGCGFDIRRYFFVETLPSTAGKRNPRIFNGEHITATRRDNGSVRLNFKPVRIDEGFIVEAFAFEVANEIVNSLKGLVEGKSARE